MRNSGEEEMRKIKVKCFRFDPSCEKEPRYQYYYVPIEGEMSVLNVLDYIYEQLDPSLAYRRYVACKRGVCTECAVRVNGKNELACRKSVDGDLTIEPVSKERVSRDLVTRRTT